MRVLVLGASGFLGAWTARALAADGHTVVAPLRSSGAWRLAGVPVEAVLVRDADSWAHAIRTSGAEVMLSLDWAGVSGPQRDDDAQADNVTRQVLSATAAVDGGIPRIVVAGSQAELGPRDDVTRAEDQPAPRAAYGRAKVMAHRELRRLVGDRADLRWARVFSVFGPLDNETTLLARLASATQEEVYPVSSGSALWSFLPADDAARALALVATAESAPAIVHVASPDAQPLRTHIETFVASLRHPPRIAYGDTANQTLQSDASGLLDLGWTPRRDIADALRDTAAWFDGDVVGDPFADRDLPTRPATGTS